MLPENSFSKTTDTAFLANSRQFYRQMINVWNWNMSLCNWTHTKKKYGFQQSGQGLLGYVTWRLKPLLQKFYGRKSRTWWSIWCDYLNHDVHPVTVFSLSFTIRHDITWAPRCFLNSRGRLPFRVHPLRVPNFCWSLSCSFIFCFLSVFFLVVFCCL